MRRFLIRCAALLLTVPCAVIAAELDVSAILKQRIIDPDLPMREVQEYTESRILPMPELTTVAAWEDYADSVRRRTLDQVVFRGEAAEWRDAETRVEWLDTLDGGPEYNVKKLRYEALPGLWIPAVLYEPKQLEGKVPAVMNVNGHDRNGKAADYKQVRCINQAKRGMLALNVEWLGMGQLNTPGLLHYRMNQLNLCGTSGVAPFYLSMKRGIDVLLSLEHADSQRIAVAGLSGGGWQTIFISSLDTRVVLADPVAGYSSFRTRARYLSDLGDSEQTPCDLATITDYAILTAMRAPRPTLLTFNSKDNCCFASGHALPPLLEAAKPVFALYGKPDNLQFHVNDDPGTHNFLKDNRQAFYRMIGQFFYSDQEFDANEIACENEIKTKEQLNVPLPENNADFNTLALKLIQDLPRDAVIPETRRQRKRWCQKMRTELKRTVHAKNYTVEAEEVEIDVTSSQPAVDEPTKATTQPKKDNAAKGEVNGPTGVCNFETPGTPADNENNDTAGAAKDELPSEVTYWRFRLADTWTVPAVELGVKKPVATVILIADGGRESAAKEAETLWKSGRRVLAVDPFYFGESKIAQRDFLFALLVDSIGDRPLGLQASQLTAIARWLKQTQPETPVEIVANGPRCSLIALTAASLETEAINSIELHESLTSLKDIVIQNRTVREAPELFCFGLLERFDIPQLNALISPH